MGNLLPFAAHFAYNFHFCYAHIFIFMGVVAKGGAVQHNIAKGAHFKFVLFILAWALPRDEERGRVSCVAVPATRRECTWRECECKESVWCECECESEVWVSVWVRVGEQRSLCCCCCCWHAISRYQWQIFCQPAASYDVNSDVDGVANANVSPSLSLPHSLTHLLCLPVCLCWRRVRAMPANFGYLSEQKYF